MGSDIHAQIEQLREDLKNDLIKYGQNIAKYMAQEIADDLSQEAHQAITDFYKYKPIYYLRHENFNNWKSYKRYYKNHGDRFTGGVDLLPSAIPDVYSGSNSSPMEVFERVYGGFHGISSITLGVPPIMDPSPIERILDKKTEILNDYSKYERNASQKAKKDKYIFLFQ